MPVVNGYTTVAELRSAMAVPSVTGDANLALELAVNAASRAIDDFCGRLFYDAGVMARLVEPKLVTPDTCETRDFHTLAGLVVETDDDGDGSYETTWAAADWQAYPYDPEAGWPWQELRAVGTRRFPTGGPRPRVRVTARWGWAAPPMPVQEFCLIYCQRLVKRADAAAGVLGIGDFGGIRIARTDPDIGLVLPYARYALRGV